MCRGDLHFDDGANPFSMVCTRRQLPQERFAVLSSTLAVGGDFRTKRAVGQGWKQGPGRQGAGCSLCSHTATQGDPG